MNRPEVSISKGYQALLLDCPHFETQGVCTTDEGFLEKNEMFFEIVKKRHKWPFQVRYDGSRDAE